MDLDLEGPEPKSDHDYLMRIYATARVMRLDLRTLCKRVDAQNGRISNLEGWRRAVLGGIAVILVLAGWLVPMGVRLMLTGAP